MSRRFLCTTGNSIATGIKLPPFKEAPWDSPDIHALDSLRAHLTALDLSQATSLRRLSAETNLLQRLGCNAEDEVWLLASDTGAGQVCSEALRIAITRAFSCVVRLHRIEGLQVFDARRFRETGLQNLTRVIVDAAAPMAGMETILCPVGGYKSVIPFAAVAGMLLSLKSYYIFEGADALIELPPLPVTFDLGLYDRLRPAVELLRQKGAVPEAELWTVLAEVAYEERPLFAPFFERDDDLLTLSPLASVLSGIEESSTYEVQLSNEARLALENAGPNHRLALERYLWRIRSPLWRSQTIHRFNGSDLTVWKIPPPQPYRLAGFIRGTSVHVCLIYVDHDLYNRQLSNHQKAEFIDQIYTPWHPSSSANNIETEYAFHLAQSIEQLEVTRQQVESLEKQMPSLKARSNRLAEAEADLWELRRENQSLRAQVDKLRCSPVTPSSAAPQTNLVTAACPPELIGTFHKLTPIKKTGAGRYRFHLQHRGQTYVGWSSPDDQIQPLMGQASRYRVVGLRSEEPSGLQLSHEPEN